VHDHDASSLYTDECNCFLRLWFDVTAEKEEAQPKSGLDRTRVGNVLRKSGGIASASSLALQENQSCLARLHHDSAAYLKQALQNN
jgi:hypothetical protein